MLYPSQMPSIFISYRRSDSQADVGRIYDRLIDHFGREAVFKDVDDIPAGADFREFLNRTLSECKVLLAVIGPGWLNAADEYSNRRLDNPADWVRLEVAEALRRKDIIVVPLLVSNARMPKVDELPPDLKELAYRNSREARPDPDFGKDMNRLISGLEQHSEKFYKSSVSPLLSSANISRQKFIKLGSLCGFGLISVLGIRQLTENIPSNSYYFHLKELLNGKRWREADQETFNVIMKIADREFEGWLDTSSLENFDCDALARIDQLWTSASNGKFGFSVQKDIYINDCGGTADGRLNENTWNCFGIKVGWLMPGETNWIDYSNLLFVSSAPRGHLPGGQWARENLIALLPRIKICSSSTVN
ncbi:GUN4 domain-containing protein [Nodosilinea sp. PGN35]|uniref:GUN4 domain-containing protein n=1 Tax=Nodosilinea sp. PGN35 TaxID=3020489 RepID=UPI0023B2B026|nr:GUN4 domain-containing protein [Nodosilinea sp. TSF1-S3]MDF0364792.1 GUN4 domain-containing protein [Nodosilinea sp. TSF1-S3]